MLTPQVSHGDSHEAMLEAGTPANARVAVSMMKARRAVTHQGAFADIIQLIKVKTAEGWIVTKLERRPGNVQAPQ